MRRSAVGVTLTLLVMALSGCNSDSELKSNAISKDTKAASSAPAAVPAVFPSPEVDVETAPAPAVALIRPTDPDERVRVIKSGRVDPFRPLVSPPQPKNRPSSAPRSTPSTSKTSPSGRKTSTKIAVKPNRSSSRLNLPKISPPKAAPSSSPNKAVLPPLPAPEPTVAKGIKVKGIVVVAGTPQAIVEAPEETTARTISVGDRVAGGQVALVGFDMSNSTSPKAVFKEAGMEVAIGVGQAPIVLASAQSPVQGLYKVTSQQ